MFQFQATKHSSRSKKVLLNILRYFSMTIYKEEHLSSTGRTKDFNSTSYPTWEYFSKYIQKEARSCFVAYSWTFLFSSSQFNSYVRNISITVLRKAAKILLHVCFRLQSSLLLQYFANITSTLGYTPEHLMFCSPYLYIFPFFFHSHWSVQASSQIFLRHSSMFITVGRNLFFFPPSYLCVSVPKSKQF